MFKHRNILWALGIGFFVILFAIGGFGYANTLITWGGVMGGLTILFIMCFYPKHKFSFPPGTIAYLIFLLFFLASLFWSKDKALSLYYFLMYFAGGLFWLIFYNLKDRILKHRPSVESILIFLGLFFGVISLYFLITKNTDPAAYSLIKYTVTNHSHHNIGDLWSIVVGVLIFKLIKKTQNRYLTCIGIAIGLCFMAISFSRSAYVGLIVGLLYLFTQLKKDIYINKVIFIFIFLASIFCIWSSLGKSLIGARLIYFTRGISSITDSPFGVGVGSFNYLVQKENNTLGNDNYTSVAHNIFLEIISGMGILSIPFFFWFYKNTKLFLENQSENGLLFRMIFVILTVNFAFNYIYFIPTVLWIWFIALALM
jgi:hypothetical protein